MRLHDLEQRRAELMTEAQAAHDADDDARFQTVERELETVTRRIERQRLIDDADRRTPAPPVDNPPRGEDPAFEREARAFSLTRALAGAAGLNVDWGRERELQGELQRRAALPAKGVLVPFQVLEKRVLTTAAPTAGPGSNIIATELWTDRMIDRLRAAPKTRILGATVLDGLVGDVDVPALKASASVGWVAENTALTFSDHQFRKVQLRPKHAGAITEMSRNMLLQVASPGVEQMVRDDFALILAEAIDRAAVAGTGTTQPLGILNTPGVTIHPLGDNGAALGLDDTADLIGYVQAADVGENTRGFLGASKLRAAAMKLKDLEGRPYTIPGVFHGERVEFSNVMPANLTQGTGTDLVSLIYGEWSDLLIAFWSVFDILVNPYEGTAFSKGNVQVRAMATCDVAVRHAASFAAITDIVA